MILYTQTKTTTTPSSPSQDLCYVKLINQKLFRSNHNRYRRRHVRLKGLVVEIEVKMFTEKFLTLFLDEQMFVDKLMIVLSPLCSLHNFSLRGQRAIRSVSNPLPSDIIPPSSAHHLTLLSAHIHPHFSSSSSSSSLFPLVLSSFSKALFTHRKSIM